VRVYPLRLTGERTVLREFRHTDVDDVLVIVGDVRVTTWLSFDNRGRAEAATMVHQAISAAREQPRTVYYLAVTLSGDDRLIGFVRLELGGVQAAKLGYAIAADHWGRGYATDAAATMIGFGLHRLGLHRISAAIGPDNEASIAVAKHLGMSYEGRIRHHVLTNGAWRDSLLYSILDHDYDPGPENASWM
jgi:[ribosomal protein S5]-alanine N-acetyltransferase